MSSSDFDSCTAYEIRQFNFNNLPEISELKNFQLKAFRTPDGWKKVSTWRGIYHVFCLYVFEIKPQHIKALRDLDGTFLSRNIIFSNTPNDLNDAFQIKGNLYAEQCLNSTRIVHIIAKLIEFCRLPAKQFIVRYEVPTTEKAVPTPESEHKVTSLPSTSYFTLADTIPSVKGTKPVSIKIGRIETPISSWRKIVVQVVDYIAQKKPESLKVLFKAFGPQNPNATLISRDAQSLRDPLQVRPRVWIEGNVNSERAINIALLFLEYSNIKPSKVQIEYIPTPGTLVSSETITDELGEPVPESPEPEDDDEIIAEDNDDNMPKLKLRWPKLSFTLDNPIPDLAFAKPLSITIGKQKLNISFWRDVILQTAIYIAQNEPDAFSLIVKHYGPTNPGRTLFSKDKNKLLSGIEVNSEYYVETNFCAKTAVKKSRLFLQSCRLPLSQVRIEYIPGGVDSSNMKTANKNNTETGSRLGPNMDYISFTKPVNKSMFNTCIVIPTQCQQTFLNNLTHIPKEGTSLPVTLWLNNSPYSVAIHNLDFSICGASPQVRFVWSQSSPIALALQKECSKSYSLFQKYVRVSSQVVPDTVTVSCGPKLDEFIICVNNSSTSSLARHTDLPERSDQMEEETKILCEKIMQLAVEKFPQNVCHDTRQLSQLRTAFPEEFSTDKDLLNYILRNHIGAYSDHWIYFLTDNVKKCLLEIIHQLQQEGQILAYYDQLYNHKQELFASISVYKDKTAISGLFTALKSNCSSMAPTFYVTPDFLALKANATIKDALLNYFDHNMTLTYESLEETFPYIPAVNIQEILKTDDDFISLANCNYTYFDKIYLDKVLCDKCLTFIESEIQKDGFISCNQIDLSSALDDNPEMTQRALLEYFCKKILPQNYVRNGNIISEASRSINSSEIIAKHCETKEYVTLGELKTLANDLSSSWQTALEIAFKKMVRVEKNLFISPDLIHFDIEEIDRVLESFMSTNDFIPLQDVYSFSSFPRYGSYIWNWFLLESYCRNFSKKFGFMVSSPNQKNVGAIVRKSANLDDYTMLMAIAVNNKEIELTENAVNSFLAEAHYIAIDNAARIQKVIEKARILRENRG